ncbi:MAG: hypothetical protein RQ745_05795 [Longimicrobiales bacterium]|nr:hypothetical protein [Longimicrobiales bacterium]
MAIAGAVTFAWTAITIMGARRERDAGGVSGGVEAPADARLYTEVLSVTDATSDGSAWFVLDRRAARVHRIDPDREEVHTFGHRGRGPGEFLDPQALTLHGDTLVIAERGGVLHLFDLDGRHLADRTAPRGGCPAPGTAQVASTPAGIVLLAVCDVGAMGLEAKVILQPFEGPVRVLAVSARNITQQGTLDPHFLPVLASSGHEIVFGLAGDRCLTRLGLDADTVGTLCHDWIERLPLPDAELRNLERLRQRAREAGGEIEIPARMPPFDRIFADGTGEIHYRGIVPDGSDARHLLLRGADSSQVALDLPAAPYVFVQDGFALLGWDDMEGTRIALRPLSEREDR